MIYSCPVCKTKLILQPEHSGQEVQCPECENTFIPEKVPPVEVYCPESAPVSFFRIFQIVIYSVLSVLIIGIVCLVLFLSAKSMFPEYFKIQEPGMKYSELQKARQTALEEEDRKQRNAVNYERRIQLQRFAENEEERSIREKNQEAEKAFLREFDRMQKEKK